MGKFYNGGAGGAGGVTEAEVQDSTYTYDADAEASDTYVITLSTAPSAYAAGQLFHFKANTVNTGAATLNVNSLGAKTIKKRHDQDLADGDIEAGAVVSVMYDGTNFQMTSQLGNAPAGAADEADPYVTGYNTLNEGSPSGYCIQRNHYLTSSNTLTANTIYFIPILMVAATINRIGLEVTTSSASTTIRMGIYQVDSSTGAPGDLLLDAGTVDSSTTGIKSITISQAVESRAYYIAFISDGGPTTRGCNDTLMDSYLGLSSPTAGEDTHLTKASQSGEHTSLSDPAVSTLSDITGTRTTVFVRKV